MRRVESERRHRIITYEYLLFQGATSQPCSVKRSCENYCCLTNPCQNGGTCHEVCDVNKRRFNCTCAPGFAGHRCHVPSLQSCQEVKVFYKVRPNGVYSIVDERNNVFPVYCDFTSETGFTWTLIQSYSLQNKAKFKGKSFFHHDMPINQHAPEWDNYRLSMSGMKFVGNKSTHWRATCNFPTDGVDFRDYIRSSKARNDLLATPASYRCTWYELVNIRGNRCVNCTAYSPYKEQLDYHIDSWSSDGLGCDFDGQPNGGIDNEDNFGFYQTTNPSFRCTSSLASTTQFWVGGPWWCIARHPSLCSSIWLLKKKTKKHLTDKGINAVEKRAWWLVTILRWLITTLSAGEWCILV